MWSGIGEISCLDHISIRTMAATVTRLLDTRELVKYECDPKLQIRSESRTDVAKNDSSPTATSVRNP